MRRQFPFLAFLALVGPMSLCVALADVSAQDTDTYLSPNHRFAVTTAVGERPTRYKVQLVDVLKNQMLASYDPEARGIDAVWSPDSRFVAINEDITHYANTLSIWCIMGRTWRKVTLPERLQDEPITRLLPKRDAALVAFWWGAHDPCAERWIGPGTLQIRVEGEAALKDSPDNTQLEADYLVVIQCSRKCTCKILSEKQLKCVIDIFTHSVK
jgi:hypothetical protein